MEIKECLDYLSSSEGRADLVDFIDKGLLDLGLPKTISELEENDELRQELVEEGIQIGFRDAKYATLIGYDKENKAVILDLTYENGNYNTISIELSSLYLSELFELALAL